MLKRKFYRDCYLQTGWIPMQPLTRPIELGDVCQIHHGYFQSLMNITNINLVENIVVSEPILLNPIDWCIRNGAQQTHCATEHYTGYDSDNAGMGEAVPSSDHGHRTRQVIEFSQPGSFLYHGDKPMCRLILNWGDLKDDATLKLTQSHYSFRDIYIVTGVAITNQWGLAIAGGDGAQLEMSASANTTDFFALMSHSSGRTEQCKDIATYERSYEQGAYFFKAKKLVLSDKIHDEYLCRLLENKSDLTDRSVANWFNNNLINLVKSNEQNLATTIGFFDWVDVSLDDLERLLV